MEPRSDESLSNNGLSDGEPGEESVQGGVPLRMHNEAMPADVDGDSRLTPLDALVLINLLNTRGSGQVSSFAPSQESPDRSSAGKMFIDTNNDSFLSPLDVLMVINQLNVQMPENARGTSVGEGEADRKDAVFATAIDWTFFSGEDEEDESGLFGDVHLLSRI
ncbi:MAG: dockerin type I domain-containing protein [Planctomycetota bacterium]|nr:dockerin type I domain-containing protein [Planctomycetota bacterium]